MEKGEAQGPRDEGHVDRGRDGRDAATSPGMLRTASSQAWTDSPAEPAEGANPASTLIQTSGFWCHERRPCWYSKPSSVWSCVKAGLGKQHGPRLDLGPQPAPLSLATLDGQPLSSPRACARVGTTDFQVQNARATQSCPQASSQPSILDKWPVGNGGL